MKRREQDRELTVTILSHSQPDEPNAESLEVIREGDAFFATGEVRSFRQRRRSYQCSPKSIRNVREFNHRRGNCLQSVRQARRVSSISFERG